MKLKRELPWLIGSLAAATTFCWYAPEYGYSPVPFFSAVFYALTGAGRLLVRFAR
jgi:hypothetical protein